MLSFQFNSSRYDLMCPIALGIIKQKAPMQCHTGCSRNMFAWHYTFHPTRILVENSDQQQSLYNQLCSVNTQEVMEIRAFSTTWQRLELLYLSELLQVSHNGWLADCPRSAVEAAGPKCIPGEIEPERIQFLDCPRGWVKTALDQSSRGVTPGKYRISDHDQQPKLMQSYRSLSGYHISQPYWLTAPTYLLPSYRAYLCALVL